MGDTTDKVYKEFDAFVDNVKQERDEMILQAHLFKAEARDEWDKLEKQWDQFALKADKVGQETKAASKDVLAATELLGQELLEGFKRIKDSF